MINLPPALNTSTSRPFSGSLSPGAGCTCGAPCSDRLVGGKRRRCERRRLDGLAVVDKRLHRQAPDHFGHAAEMVAVEMRNQQVVQLADARVAGGRQDAIRIAVGEPGVPGVDEHRLSGGRDDQRGLPALDVDEVDVQRSALLRGRRAGCDQRSRSPSPRSDRIERHDTERWPGPVARERGGGCKLSRMLKRLAACILAALVSATLVVATSRPAQATAGSHLPSRLADQEFWSLADRPVRGRGHVPVGQPAVERAVAPARHPRPGRDGRESGTRSRLHRRRPRAELHLHRRAQAVDGVHRGHPAREPRPAPDVQGALRAVGRSRRVRLAPLLPAAPGRS